MPFLDAVVFAWSVLVTYPSIWRLYPEVGLKDRRDLKFLIDVSLMLPCILFFIF